MCQKQRERGYKKVKAFKKKTTKGRGGLKKNIKAPRICGKKNQKGYTSKKTTLTGSFIEKKDTQTGTAYLRRGTKVGGGGEKKVTKPKQGTRKKHKPRCTPAGGRRSLTSND